MAIPSDDLALILTARANQPKYIPQLIAYFLTFLTAYSSTMALDPAAAHLWFTWKAMAIGMGALGFGHGLTSLPIPQFVSTPVSPVPNVPASIVAPPPMKQAHEP